ncbi:MAG: hypothetical protein Q9226_002146 [Calogaya cf. arnoldii]
MPPWLSPRLLNQRSEEKLQPSRHQLGSFSSRSHVSSKPCKLSRCIGAIDLKAPIIAQDIAMRRMADRKAQIVEDGVDLFVSVGGMWEFIGDNEAEEEGAVEMVGCVVCGVFTGEG